MLDVYEKNLRSLNVECSSICNLTCKMCYRNKKKFCEDNLKLENAKIILKKLSVLDKKIDNIYFHWRGEPTLNKSLDDIVSLTRSKFPKSKLILFTNGQLLYIENFLKLSQAGIDKIYFSIDSINSMTYKKIRGKSIEPVINNLKSIITNVNEKSKNIELLVNTVLLDENLLELLEIRKFFNNLGIQVKFKTDSRKLFPVEEKYGCKHIGSTLYIGVDGEVSPCCVDVENRLSLGNLLYDELDSIVNNNLILKILRSTQFKDKKVEVCRICYQGGEKNETTY